MILTNSQYELLSKCVGAGQLDSAPIVIFGNEPGIAGARDIEHALSIFESRYNAGKIFKIGEGFSIVSNDSQPVNSIFLQFCARLELGLKHRREEFFDQLSLQGIAVLNNHIMNSLFNGNSSLINLRPLPRSTERLWVYSNIKEKDYYKLYNFNRKGDFTDQFKQQRMQVMKQAFSMIKDSLILGTGDKHNKKEFLKLMYPNILFEEINLDGLQILVSRYPRIILSNYYDHRSGIKLSGLKQIYNFIIENFIGEYIK